MRAMLTTRGFMECWPPFARTLGKVKNGISEEHNSMYREVISPHFVNSISIKPLVGKGDGKGEGEAGVNNFNITLLSILPQPKPSYMHPLGFHHANQSLTQVV
jgi:hypothetical protein